MRMSRFDWLARFFRPTAPHEKAKRVKSEPKEERRWSVLGIEVMAHTKSEARARAKKQLGYKDRLPVGTVVKEIVSDPV